MKAACVSPDHVCEAVNFIRRRLCGNDVPPRIHGYEEEKRQLYNVISRTVSIGESNSVLLIGPRGSGKTMLLRSVLEELKQSTDVNNCLIQVYLNGLLQTDDRISLRAITRQLNLDNVVGDRIFGSFAENLQFLLEALKRGDRGSKSILFVLDEFDLFAHHKNQTLLYNLFDVAQSAQAPICVLGLTARMDVTELLEKRVKSRFSHRQIQLFPALPFPSYVQLFRDYLSLPPALVDDRYMLDWNTRVQEISEEPVVVDALRNQYNLDANIQSLRNFMLPPLCQVESGRPLLEAADFVGSYKLFHATDSKAAVMQGLSVLELCLIVAMKHLTEIYHNEPFNFEMVFREYQKFCQRRSAVQLFDKSIVLKAFEHLLLLELVRPAAGGGGAEGCGGALRTQKEFRLMSLMVDPSEIMDVVQRYPSCPTEVKHWAGSSVNA